MVTINELLDRSASEIAALPDATIRAMSYGIRYFDLRAAGMEATPERVANLQLLRDRLRALEEAEERPSASSPELVLCDCGHSVPRKLVMSASRGTSCPDCYDRMSE